MWPFSKPKSTANTDKAVSNQVLNPFTEVQVLAAHKDIVHVLKAASTDMVLSGDDTGLIHAWNVREARLISRLQGHTRRITACCALNGDTVVSAASDRTVRFWDLRSGECLKVIEGLTSSIRAIVNVDHNIVACVGPDITLYDYAGTLLQTVLRPDACQEDLTTALTIQGGRLLTASIETVELFNWEKAVAARDTDPNPSETAIVTTNLSESHPHTGSIACLEAIGSAAFAVATTSGVVLLWSTHSNVAPYRSWKLPASAGSVDGMHKRDEASVEFSIGALKAIGRSLLAVAVRTDVYIYNLGTCQLVNKISSAHEASIYHLACLAQDRLLVTGAEDSLLQLWSLAHYFPEAKDDWSPTQAAIALLESDLMTASVSSSTATGSTSTRTDRRDAPAPLSVGALAGHTASITGLVVCNNHMLVSASADGALHVWKNGAWKWRYANIITDHMLQREPALG
eukprot:m.41610 g.41610  ORF g.41610 m.41610 type:complete len:457 (+) comp12843_c0_seq1:48-1418(+)